MHLVFLNQYYPPDAAPTGVMLESVAERLAADGHSVTVLCAAGGYAGGQKPEAETAKVPELEAASAPSPIRNPSPRILRIGATKLGRETFLGKLLDYASFYAGVAWVLLTVHPRPERIVALTTPPFLSVLARVISKFRGADHAHWVMDLYPDVMAAYGMLDEGGGLHRILAGLARFGFGGGRCAAVLTLGPDMAERVAKVMGEKEKVDARSHLPTASVRWVPLWGTEETEGTRTTTAIDAQPAAHSLRRERGWEDDELVVMYSGNMGLGHRFSEVLEIAEGLGRQAGPLAAGVAVDGSDPISIQNHNYEIRPPSKTRFVFYGGGKRREEIRDFMRKHPGGLVELHDYVAAEMLGPHLQSADVHLVSLDAEWTGTMVPSKLQGIFAAGRPVVFIGSSDSSIGSWVLESGGGWVVEPGDAGALAAAIQEAGDSRQRALRGHAARCFAGRYFDKTSNVARVAEVLGGSTRFSI
jgi:colanic acid biosynthesis glycosyl transferase WcaI